MSKNIDEKSEKWLREQEKYQYEQYLKLKKKYEKVSENKELIADAIIAILKDGGTIITASARGVGCGLADVDDLLDAYGLLRQYGEIDCKLYEEVGGWDEEE